MTEVSGMANIERWLNEWVDRHDAGPDGTDDETLAVFDFIAELRPQIEAADQQLLGAVEAIAELIQAGEYAVRPEAEWEEHERWGRAVSRARALLGGR